MSHVPCCPVPRAAARGEGAPCFCPDATRTVAVSLSQDFLSVTAENGKDVSEAIGYLTTWAIGSERHSGRVSLYGDRLGNLHANYRNANDDVSYELYGQRGEDGSYSFHS